jgi:uncharacterized OB-fold protein
MTTNSPYLTEAIAELFPDAISRQFWDRCAQHVLAFQKCTACGAFRNPPVPICHVCRSTDVEWSPVSGVGTVYSFTIVHHAVHPGLLDKIPFNVCLVEFADAPGVRLITNVVDAGPDELEIGMPVRLHWEDLANGSTLPRFERMPRP